MRKTTAILAGMAVLLSLAACGKPAAPETLTFLGVAGLWFTEEMPEGGGSALDPDTLRIGLTYDGKQIFTLLRVPMPEDVQADEVAEAWLYLKILDTNGTCGPRVALLEEPWTRGITCEAAKALGFSWYPASTALTPDGWLQLGVKDYVKACLNGAENHGLAIFEGNQSTETLFGTGGQDAPRLELLVEKR